MAGLNLSLKGVEVQRQTTGNNFYSTVPAGTYKVVVGKTEVKETKTGGAAVILGYKIIAGEHEGKLIKDFINIKNANPTAAQIGLQRLATVAFATGFGGQEIADSDDLLELESFEVVVTVQDDGEYQNNRVKAVLCTRDVNAKAAAPKAAAPVAKAATKKPWEK
jgi:hypothetical protein